jgi:hypothetical protein
MRHSAVLDEVRAADGRGFRVEAIDQTPDVALPDEFEPKRLRRRTLQIVAVLAVVGLVLLLAPGLGEVRDLLTRAQPEWLALAVAFEALSCVSYVMMFRPIFCQNMPWRTSWEIGLAELGAGSIVPASGAGGLALGAWILREGGMPAQRIASRSVAFFLIKSSVNFIAVALLGTIVALGLLGPDLSLWLTAVPAVGAVLVIAAVLVVPRLGVGAPVSDEAGRIRRAIHEVRKALVGGAREAVQMVRSRNALVIVGARPLPYHALPPREREGVRRSLRVPNSLLSGVRDGHGGCLDAPARGTADVPVSFPPARPRRSHGEPETR